MKYVAVLDISFRCIVKFFQSDVEVEVEIRKST